MKNINVFYCCGCIRMLKFKTAIFLIIFLACPVTFSSISQQVIVEDDPAITEVVINMPLKMQ